ncbi:MAG: HAMP domain-containing histidine kinase [Deltaproteobacteria bacterium]|nr:HAMP domain-containing histidine kinase [Deltaproteobacteria bacterium]
MSQVFREAVGEAQEQYDTLLTHLSLIRDLTRLGHQASSFEELATELARTLVLGLGHERVVVTSCRASEASSVVGSFSQSERFGGAAEPLPAAVQALAADVVRARALVRWGGDGVGERRQLPGELRGSVVGFPLAIGGECVGAVLCLQLVPICWDLVSQRALELVGDIITQVVTLAHMRLSMGAIHAGLEAELGTTRHRVERQEETLRAQSERIGDLAGSLIRSSRAKNTFLALMSHELRTPLAVILGFGSLLREEAAGPINQRQGEYLDRITSNGRHLHQLVEDMLFFVDAETARITPSPAAVDLAAVLRDVAEAIPRHGAPDAPALCVDIAPDAATVRTDAALLRRVLFHVVGNAFKFTERGEIRVEAARAPGGRGWRIRVADTGIGIAPAQLGRIFELFRQGDDSHARRHEGLGLGLSLVRACLALLHGDCRVTPGVSGGTVVELVIPDLSAPARADGAENVATADARPATMALAR